MQGRVGCDGSRDELIWCTTRPRHAYVLCTLDVADAKTGPCHNLDVD